MNAVLAVAIAELRLVDQNYDQLMIKLGFDCEPFSALVEQGEYKYDADNLET